MMRPTDTGKSTKRSRLLLAAAVGFVALAWLFLAPTELGGSVDYVVTDGNSMEPLLHNGDLSVVRHVEDYEVGDVAAYTSPQLGRVVLHRIEAVEDGRFTFKGDNNSWLDSERLQAKDMVGKLVVNIPRVGGVIGTFGSPIPAAIAAIAVAGLIGMIADRRRRRDDVPDLVPAARTNRFQFMSLVVVTRPVLKAAGIATVILGAVVVSAFGRSPEVQSTVDTRYEHDGRFTYFAPTANDSAMGGATLGNGTPIFFKLSDMLDVTFRYAFDADAAFDVESRGRLVTYLQTDTGWSDKVATTPWQELTDGRGELATTVDLAWLQNAVRTVRSETGVVTGTYRVTFSPEVETTGEVDGGAVHDRFSPDLSFQVDDVQLLPLGASVDQPLAALNPAETGIVEVPITEPATIRLVRFEIPVATGRVLGAVGIAISLLVLAFFGWIYRRALSGDEPGRIAALHGDAIVDIEPGQIEGALDVPSFDALLRAAGPEGLILHCDEGRCDSYFVLDQQPFRYRVVRENEETSDQPATSNTFEMFPQLRSVVFVEELGHGRTA